VHMRMGLRLAADAETGVLPFTKLVPVHIAGKIAVDRTRRDKQRGVETARLQPRKGLLKDGQVGVVDGDRHGAVGKRPARPKIFDNLFQGPDGVRTVGKLFEMFLELRDPDIGAWVSVLAKSMIHEDCRMIGGTCGGDNAKEGAGQNHGQQEQSFHQGYGNHLLDKPQVDQALTILC